MPIYEYECDKCGHAFEREQSISDPPVKICPKCKSRRVTKLISRSSFVLKGGGWYADGYADSKKASTPDSAPSSVSDTPAASDSTSATSDSKSATDAKGGDGAKKADSKPAPSGKAATSGKSSKSSKGSGKSAA